MIASLTGILTTIGKSEIIIEVNGVGYLLNVTSKLISTLGEIGSTLSVFKDLQIKDDKILMYGFTTVADQDFFRWYAQLLGYNHQSSIWYEKSYGLFDKKYLEESKNFTKKNKKSNIVIRKFKSLFE